MKHMKNRKILTGVALIASSLCAKASPLPFSIGANLTFRTTDIRDGLKWGRQVFIPQFEIQASPFEKGTFYVGYKAYLGTKNKYDLSPLITEMWTAAVKSQIQGSGVAIRAAADTKISNASNQDEKNQIKADADTTLRNLKKLEDDLFAGNAKDTVYFDAHLKGLGRAFFKDNSEGLKLNSNRQDFYVGYSTNANELVTIDCGLQFLLYKKNFGLSPNTVQVHKSNTEKFFLSHDEASNTLKIFEGIKKIHDTMKIVKIADTRYEIQASLPCPKLSDKDVSVYLKIGTEYPLSNATLGASLKTAYDIKWHFLNLEGQLDYTYDLSSLGVKGLSLDTYALLAYRRCERPFGINIGNLFNKGWVNYGIGAGLSFGFHEMAKVVASIKFDGNKKKEHSFASFLNKGKKHFVYGEVALNIAF